MIEMFQHTTEQLERDYDSVKTAIVLALVNEGYMTQDEADEWCTTHTIILRKKSIFRTFTNRFKKKKGVEKGQYMLVVKLVEPKEEKDAERHNGGNDEASGHTNLKTKDSKTSSSSGSGECCGTIFP